MPGPHGGPGGANRFAKPKNTKKTILRILHYLSPSKIPLVGVALLILITVGANLGGSYYMRPLINKLVGGGFGGKEDVTVQHHAALVAYLTKRPVKCKLTRAESLLIHPKRHPMEMEFAMGCDENGIIQGVAANVIADTGAYASLGGPVLERACTHAAGPYHYENFQIDGYAYYTNNPPAGAFRGFGVTQTCFCVETLLNEMADLVGISPWEIRYRNAIRPGLPLPNGQIVGPETGLVETLEAVKPYFDKAKYVGVACAMKNAGVGVGIPDTGRCRLTVEDGKVHIRAGASCIGQGLGTVLVQMCCDQLGLKQQDIVYERSNTFEAPDSGTTSGSRQTLITGEACRRACTDLKKALEGKVLSDLNGTEYYGEYLAKTDPLGAPVPNPVSHVAYGYATQLCELDEDGKVKLLAAAHDVGKAVNPLSCEGQIEGGVVMSMGFALTEQYPLEDCRPAAKYGTLGLLKANQVPEIKAIAGDTISRGTDVPALNRTKKWNFVPVAKAGDKVSMEMADAIQNAAVPAVWIQTEERNVKVLSNMMVDLHAFLPNADKKKLGVTEEVYYPRLKAILDEFSTEEERFDAIKKNIPD